MTPKAPLGTPHSWKSKFQAWLTRLTGAGLPPVSAPSPTLLALNRTLEAQQRRIDELNEWRIELQHERSDIMLALRCKDDPVWIAKYGHTLSPAAQRLLGLT